jgi:hypothetical protein
MHPVVIALLVFGIPSLLTFGGSWFGRRYIDRMLSIPEPVDRNGPLFVRIGE